MALKQEKVKTFVQAPFVLALNLFGFLLEFILELPFMIAFFLTKRTKEKGERLRAEGKNLEADQSE